MQIPPSPRLLAIAAAALATTALVVGRPAGGPALAPHHVSLAALEALGQEVRVTTHAVRGPVHYLEGRGGNIGVSAGDDGVLLIDDQFAEMARAIETALAELSDAAPTFLLNTHYHFDHTGGNAHFGAAATILAHDNVRKRLAEGTSLFGRATPPAPPEALPVVTYDDSVSVHFNGEEIRVQHFPASHTDGDSVVFFTGSKVVHMGDLFFAGRLPFVDLDHGGSVRGLSESVRAVAGRIDASWKIIPGHGSLSTLDDLKAYQAMLESVLDAVGQGLEAGSTPAQMVADGLLDEWESWASDFVSLESFAETVARDLQR